MVTAYIDESGIGRDEAYVCVGGYIAPDDVWKDFNAAWVNRLAESGLSYFHMTDFKADRPPFCPPILNRAAHENLEHDLTNILSRFDLHGCVIRIDRASWDELITGYRLSFNGDAVGFALRQAAIRFADLRQIFFSEEPLRVVYGDSHLTDKLSSIISVFQVIRDRAPERYHGISFEVMRHCPGIQAADMLLWEVRNHSIQALHVEVGEFINPNRNLQRIGQKAQQVIYDRDQIMGVYRRTYSTLDDG